MFVLNMHSHSLLGCGLIGGRQMYLFERVALGNLRDYLRQVRVVPFVPCPIPVCSNECVCVEMFTSIVLRRPTQSAFIG